MGNLAKREEIILRYLGNRKKLGWDIFDCLVEKSDEIRQALIDLGDAWLVYLYAAYVDKSPRDDTRAAVLANPIVSYKYSKFVDREPRDDTRQAVSKALYWKKRYEEWERGNESLPGKK